MFIEVASLSSSVPYTDIRVPWTHLMMHASVTKSFSDSGDDSSGKVLTATGTSAAAEARGGAPSDTGDVGDVGTAAGRRKPYE